MMNNGQNPYGAYYNPYYQVMPNQMSVNPMQQPIPQRTGNVGVGGRIVNNETEITPNEIPMDGSVSLFPTNDYSKIYAKAWTANGAIKTVTFVPEVVPPTETSSSPSSSKTDMESFAKFQNDVLERLDRIEKAQKRSNGYKPKYDNAPKKEGAQNE